MMLNRENKTIFRRLYDSKPLVFISEALIGMQFVRKYTPWLTLSSTIFNFLPSSNWQTIWRSVDLQEGSTALRKLELRMELKYPVLSYNWRLVYGLKYLNMIINIGKI